MENSGSNGRGWVGTFRWWFEAILPKRKPASAYLQPQTITHRNGGPSMWDLVIADFRGRDEFGHRKYGGPLEAHDGRDTLADAYQEALDLAVYLRKLIYERDGA
jgi:hypothetical protein